MNVCHYCMKENGHTEFCSELRKRARDSNITHAINHMCRRATVSGYKELFGEKDKNLIPMWEKSKEDWCQIAMDMISKANQSGGLNTIYMPEA